MQRMLHATSGERAPASELQKRSTGRTIYILDEPTTGLHFDDIRKLLAVINALVGKGNTVIVIEHNLDVIKTSDWIDRHGTRRRHRRRRRHPGRYRGGARKLHRQVPGRDIGNRGTPASAPRKSNGRPKATA
jgi:hypothetical protein